MSDDPFSDEEPFDVEHERSVARLELLGLEAEIRRLNEEKHKLRALGLPALQDFIDEKLINAEQWARAIAEFVHCASDRA